MTLLLLLLAAALNIYVAEVISHYDGDSLTVRVEHWPQHYTIVKIRIMGIDTPELKGKCKAERDLALTAKKELQRLAPIGTTVILRDLKPDKFGGRYDAMVFRELQPGAHPAHGLSVAGALIDAGLAKPYDGKGARKGWC